MSRRSSTLLYKREVNVIFCGLVELCLFCVQDIFGCVCGLLNNKVNKKKHFISNCHPKIKLVVSMLHVHFFFFHLLLPSLLSLSFYPFLHFVVVDALSPMMLLHYCDCCSCTISTEQWHKQLYSIRFGLKNSKINRAQRQDVWKKLPFLWKMHWIVHKLLWGFWKCREWMEQPFQWHKREKNVSKIGEYFIINSGLSLCGRFWYLFGEKKGKFLWILGNFVDYIFHEKSSHFVWVWCNGYFVNTICDNWIH